MNAPGIDFRKIRSHKGSQDHAFEELCCQLASLEARESESQFFRKGTGADAGVECYVRRRGGAEIAWQAKWFFTFAASQLQQLDKSISTALEKHPRLSRYIVCLPIDLRDGRVGRAYTELQRWQRWVKKWKKYASLKLKKNISFELWGSSKLTELLTSNDARHNGRIRFWFSDTLLDKQWLEARFSESRAILGDRYTPETNVDLPIRRVLSTFTREEAMRLEIEEWSGKIDEAIYRAIDAANRKIASDKAQLAEELQSTAEQLSKSISDLPMLASDIVPIELWHSLTVEVLRKANLCMLALEAGSAEEEKSREQREYASYSLTRLSNTLRDFRYALAEDRWRLVNERRLLVFGDAGVGKSHLLADVAQANTANGYPTILVVGSLFTDGDPWSQIMAHLGMASIDRDVFLGALDAAGQAANSRALLLIDAINERNGLDVWPSRLAGFLKAVEPFVHVGLAVSCRSTYLPFLTGSLNEKQLPRIQHTGFAGHTGQAAQTYLDRRGIVRMAAPNLLPEFENPLFLKTCCDYLIKEGKREFPRGLRGVTQIFNFYFDAVSHHIETRLKLDPNQKLLARAISTLTEASEESERGYVPKTDALERLEGVLASGGSYERSLLGQLLSEGVLADEPIKTESGEIEEYVRFTFERYSDFRIAARLLSAHLDISKPVESFAVGGALHKYLTGPEAFKRLGVMEALATQLPELADVEFPDVLPRDQQSEYLGQQAFLQSVLWRDQKCFRQRTLDLLKAISSRSGTDWALRILCAVATEPDNKFNGDYLHALLMAMEMPTRDEKWSIYVAVNGDSDDHPIETLIEWVTHNGAREMEIDRARLVATLLCWLLSTSNRGIRDRSTKALVSLLSVRLELAAHIVGKFAAVDDCYVLDRVLASAYGAALQGRTMFGLRELSKSAFDAVFSGDQTIPHVLVRDHARGIIEFALRNSLIDETIDIHRVRPPYKSRWPIEKVTERTVKRYKESWDHGKYRDAIVGSAVNDGDFARYQIDPAVGNWSSLPVAMAGQNQEEVFEAWRKRSVTRPALAKTLKRLVSVFNRLRKQSNQHSSPRIFFKLIDDSKAASSDTSEPSEKVESKDEVRARVLTESFRKQLGKRRWQDYCEYARQFVQRGTWIEGYYDRWPPRVDSASIRRWVCKRAHDLGWSQERFSDFERNIRGHDRNEHRVERIGKKYQWIALHEVMGYLGDNLAFISDDREVLGVFQGPWQTFLRDIDPTLLVRETFDDPWKQWKPTWWMPAKTFLVSISPAERLAWRRNSDDLWNQSQMIEVTDPVTARDWLVLQESVGWYQYSTSRGERSFDRRAYASVECLVVNHSNRQKLIRQMSGKVWHGGHDLPSIDLPHSAYIGEYLWHPMYVQKQGWADSNGFGEIEIPTQPMSAAYSARASGYDYSLSKSFSVNLPPPGICRRLGLRLCDGQQLSFSGSAGQILFKDPSVTESGPSASLVDRAAFLNFLRREKLDAIWILTSGKEVFSTERSNGGWGGEQKRCSLFWFDKNGLKTKEFVLHAEPSSDQLKKFWEETDELASLAATRAVRSHHGNSPRRSPQRRKKLSKQTKRKRKATVSKLRKK
jgi:hypothetical protein